MNATYDDEKISRFVNQHGLEGYGFWWKLLEIVASQTENNEPAICTYNIKRWSNLFGVSSRKYVKLATFLDQVGLIKMSIQDKMISVEIPLLYELKEESTLDNLVTSCPASNRSKGDTSLREWLQ